MADGGGWGFAAGGEVVLVPTEYEWGIGRVGGEGGGGGENHVSVWDALVFGFFEQMRRVSLKFGESINFTPPLLNSGPTAGRGRMVILGVPNSGRERFRPRACVLRRPLCMNVFRRRLRGV